MRTYVLVDSRFPFKIFDTSFTASPNPAVYLSREGSPSAMFLIPPPTEKPKEVGR